MTSHIKHFWAAFDHANNEYIVASALLFQTVDIMSRASKKRYLPKTADIFRFF